MFQPGGDARTASNMGGIQDVKVWDELIWVFCLGVFHARHGLD